MPKSQLTLFTAVGDFALRKSSKEIGIKIIWKKHRI